MTKLIGVALLAACAFAQQRQETAVENAPAARRLVELRHLSGPRADRAADLIRQFMHPVGRISIDSQLKSAVLVGPVDVVTGAEALLRKFDVPEGGGGGAQVSLAVHLIEASNSDEPRGTPVHKVIEPAVEQMRRAFQYKSYRQLDTVLLVGRGTTRSLVTGQLPLVVPSERPDSRTTYEAGYESLQAFPDSKTVAIKNFRFGMSVPQQKGIHTSQTSLLSDLTINYGQKLVIGKLSADQPNNAIFLVLTVEIQ